MPRITFTRRLAAAALLLACVGCERASSEASNVTARDSAGVPIVENRAGEWNEQSAWRVEAQPSLAIGMVEGDPEYQLHQVRGAIRRADGSIVVADGGSDELRFYDANGRHIRSVGRGGEGPGEFQVISMLTRFPGDSLLVWDFPLRRVTLFSADGTLGRTFPGPTFDEPFYYFHTAFSDGSLLGSLDGGIDGSNAEPGVRRNTSLFFRFSPNGAVDTVGELFSNEAYVDLSDGMMVIAMPFGKNAVFATSGNDFLYGSSESYEIRTYTGDGALKRIVRSAQPSTAVTQAHIGALVESRLKGSDDPARRRRLEQTYNGVTYPGTMPAYGELKVDADGNVWVGDYRAPGDDQPIWTVFNGSGRLLGRLPTPPGLTIYEIGSDYLLGMQRDAEDVERVVVLPLLKPP